MKKEIIFVIPSLDAGGAEKSLINLLNQFDFNRYNVDLFLFNQRGLFLKSLPKEVNLLSSNNSFKIFGKPLISSCVQFCLKGNFKLAINRLLFFFNHKIQKNVAKAEQASWKNLSKSLEPLAKQYDCAIGYLEKSSIYFIVDKVVATKKIGWVHTNYATSGMDSNFDKFYFEELSNLVTVSDECANSLKNYFPSVQHNIKVIQNIVSPKMIESLSVADIADKFDDDYINVLTIARLSIEKGVDLAIEAFALLQNEQKKFRLYIIGEGTERGRLEKIIQEKNLQNNVFLLGLKTNPYPYLKQCFIYLQPSRYEGKSIAIDEAKSLKKVILATNFSTATDQITHLKNGMICDMNSSAIARSILEISEDDKFQATLIQNLVKENVGTEEEIYKLYQLTNG